LHNLWVKNDPKNAKVHPAYAGDLSGVIFPRPNGDPAQEGLRFALITAQPFPDRLRLVILRRIGQIVVGLCSGNLNVF